MNEVKPLGRKILIAAAGIVLIVGLIAVALKLELLATPKPPPNGSRQTVVFQDGGKLEILGVSVGERVVEISRPKWFFLRYFSSKGSSGGTWGGLNVSSESEDGNVIRCRLRSDSPTAMLMEFRMTESDGREMRLSSYLTQRQLVGQDDRISGKRGSLGFFQPKDDSVPTLRAEMVKAGLQVLIQHQDPQGGWINFMGPSMYHEPWPGRYIVALTAWQRNLPTLQCRAIRADGEMAEFSLENPDYRKSPLPGATKPLPQVHSGGDYTLTARTVERFATPGDHPFSQVELDFVSGGKPVGDGRFRSLTFEGGTVEDEWGNVVKFQRETIRKKTNFGSFLPAASKRMTVNLTVVRTVNTPRYATTGFPVLEGVVGPDGLGVEFKPLPDAARFGIVSMPVGRINRVGPAWVDAVRKDWRELSFKLSGENGTKEFEALEARIGKLGQWQFLVFPEGSSQSAGILANPNDGGYGSGIGRSHFDRQVTWLGPPAMLLPGAKIRLGVHEPLKNDDVRFDLELPPLIQPR
jgi:hypothetical protein